MTPLYVMIGFGLIGLYWLNMKQEEESPKRRPDFVFEGNYAQEAPPSTPLDKDVAMIRKYVPDYDKQ